MFEPDVKKLTERKDVKGLIRALKYKDPEVRRQAAYSLGTLKATQAVAALIETTRDPEYYVRSWAAAALSQIGGPGAADAVFALLEDPRMEVKRDAALSLGRLGDARAVAPIVGHMGGMDVPGRREAALLLGKLGDPWAVKQLTSSLRDDYGVCAAAAESLGKLKDRAAVEPLQEALTRLEEEFNEKYEERNRQSMEAAAGLASGSDQLGSLLSYTANFIQQKNHQDAIDKIKQALKEIEGG